MSNSNERIIPHNGMLVRVDIPQLIPTDDYNGRRRIYELAEMMVYEVSYGKLNIESTYQCFDTIIVPKGFRTDFATIPIILQLFLGNRDSYMEESIFHDAMCEYDVPRWVANSKMRAIMLALGRPWWKRFAIFWGLMIFGYKSPFRRFSVLVSGKWRNFGKVS